MADLEESEGAWEYFRDAAYYDMWCVRLRSDREFGKGFHLINGAEASNLCGLLNTFSRTQGNPNG